MREPAGEVRAVAEGAYGALNASDLERFLEFVADDVEFTSLVAEAEGTSYRGHDGVRAWWADVPGSFDEMRWEVLEIRGRADTGVAHVRLTGSLAGIRVEQTVWQAVRLRGGKAAWWAFFRDERDAVEAAGLAGDAVELVRAVIGAAPGDWEWVRSVMDPEVRLDQSRFPDGGVYHGPDGFADFYRRWFGTWDDLSIEAERFVEQGDRVVVFMRISGRGKGSGVAVKLYPVDVWRVRDGKIVELVAYPDPAEALEAVGLSR